MNQTTILLVFVKNPIPGKTKTRLAATVGNERALEVYKGLVEHTKNCIQDLTIQKAIYFSEQVDQDILHVPGATYAVQRGDDLGDRILNALQEQREQGGEKLLIIGTDCFELSPEILEEAVQALDRVDVVAGPARDGGYYLLGMKEVKKALFTGIAWSTSEVLEQTLEVCQKEDLSYHCLPVLSDVDREEDLPEHWRK